MNVIYVNTNLSGVYLKRFLDPNNTTAVQHEVTRNLTHLILGAATKNTKFGINDSTIDPNKKNPLLIPVFRAALPMYVVAQTAFPEADTALVLCTKNKRMVGKNSVEINWMGRKAFATGMLCPRCTPPPWITPLCPFLLGLCSWAWRNNTNRNVLQNRTSMGKISC